MDTIGLISDIKNKRDQFDQLGNIYAPATGVTVDKVYFDGVSCYWITPSELHSANVVIYVHGGGYIMGSFLSHKAMVSHIAERLGAKTLFVEYALAPENPYPEGIEDFLKVYKQIQEQFKSVKIFVIGDSAGGGILLSSLYRMQDLQLPHPEGIVLISPWFDLECNNDSYETNKFIDPIFTKSDIQQYASLYAGNQNLSEINPGRNHLTSCPPALIMVGTNELLEDDSKNFYTEINKIQPKSKLSIYKDQSHVWLLTDINSSGSQKAIEEMNEFINNPNQKDVIQVK